MRADKRAAAAVFQHLIELRNSQEARQVGRLALDIANYSQKEPISKKDQNDRRPDDHFCVRACRVREW